MSETKLNQSIKLETGSEIRHRYRDTIDGLAIMWKFLQNEYIIPVQKSDENHLKNKALKIFCSYILDETESNVVFIEYRKN